MRWQVVLTRQAGKQLKKLPEDVVLICQLLVENLREKGPSQATWPNYGKLRGTKKNEDKRHCHLIKGNPTYVSCWAVDKQKQLIEVYYVGTHEGAPY